MILELIENANLIFLGIAVISVFSMLSYLKKRGIASSRIVSFNPLILLEYPKHTKATYGRVGIWFWIFVCSFSLLIMTGITELILFLTQVK